MKKLLVLITIAVSSFFVLAACNAGPEVEAPVEEEVSVDTEVSVEVAKPETVDVNGIYEEVVEDIAEEGEQNAVDELKEESEMNTGYYDEARSSLDIKKCDEITDEEDQSSCREIIKIEIMRTAAEANDESICENLDQLEFRSECIESVKAYNTVEEQPVEVSDDGI